MPTSSQKFHASNFREFHYTGLNADVHSGIVSCTYELRGPQFTVPFSEYWRIPVLDGRPPNVPRFKALARLLYLAVGLSYYKAAAPERICLPGHWTESEVGFLDSLISNGLAEFAARNDLALPLEVRIDADYVDAAQAQGSHSVLTQGQMVLTPVGGGKDSCVAIESLRAIGYEQVLFAVGDFDPIRRVAERAQLPLITAGRQIDQRLLQINKAGALNGHVPVTAMNSVAACLSALSLGANAVSMANEKSASIATRELHGTAVNHQWSKSLEFETLLRKCIASDHVPVDYFSLLRPYSEYRIARRFADFRQYHDVFVSCGSAFKTSVRQRTQWCGKCDKCRFVALILSPFLDIEYVESRVGNSAARDSDASGWADLLGVGAGRPYDCIGTEEESRLALLTARPSWQQNEALMALALRLRDWRMTPSEEREVLTAGDDHFCPPGLETVLDESI